MTDILVAALYKFVSLPDHKDLQAQIRDAGERCGVLGTILLANEGINGTVAGSADGVSEFLSYLKSDSRLADLEHKESVATKAPFYRFKVKLKAEIVTMGVPDIDPESQAGTYVDPKDWNALISDPDVVVIDARNDYEVGIGSFQGAQNPETTSFGELPAWLDSNAHLQDKPRVAMYCTGGIRCEKSTAYLKAQGFDEVFHLKGGILKYLEHVDEKESLWEGECFVFDERVSVVHGLETGSYALCRACRRPINEADRLHVDFVEGVSCASCVDEYDEATRARFAERQKQVELAVARNERHVGATYDKSGADDELDELRKPVIARAPESEHPILYTFRRCPYAMRARMALQATGRTCELREIVLRDKPAHMVEVSPKATVPVLILEDGSVLEESLDVMLWALDDNDPFNWLSPHMGSFDTMMALISRADGEFKHHLDRYKYANRYEEEGAVAEEHREQGSEFLRELNELLDQGAWLFGPRACLADVAIGPFVRQFANTDRAWFDAQDWPQLRRWLESFLESPLFMDVMKKYAPWKPGDADILFPETENATWTRSSR